MQNTQLDELAFLGNSRAVHDFEFGFAKRRRHLVLDHFDSGHRTDHFLAILDRPDAANIHAYRRIELQGVAAGGRFWIAEHHADFHADLIDENHDGIRPLDVAGQFAQRLRHEPRLQAHVLVAHLAFNFRLRRERGDRVDHDHIYRTGPYQHAGNFQRLFAGIGLRDQQVVDFDPELFRVHRIERMFGIDERRRAAVTLRRSDDGQRQRGFTRRLRAEDFDDAAARNAAHAERDVQSQRARGDGVDLVGGAGIAQAHDRAFTKLFFYLAQRGRESFLAILFHGESSTKCAAIISYSAPNAHLIWTEIAEISLNSVTHPVVARYRLLYRSSVRPSYRSAPG